MISRLADYANASPMQLLAGDLKIVAETMIALKGAMESETSTEAPWFDSAIGCIKDVIRRVESGIAEGHNLADYMPVVGADLKYVAHSLARAQGIYDISAGGRHSWTDPVLAIARARAEEMDPDSRKIGVLQGQISALMDRNAMLEGQNHSMTEALVGKYGIGSGLQILEDALRKHTKADHGDAPLGTDANQARAWHASMASAYQHSLEMLNSGTVLALCADIQARQGSVVEEEEGESFRPPV